MEGVVRPLADKTFVCYDAGVNRLSSLASYAPLWCKSNFSFLEGASHPDELVEEAARLGLRSLALTDRDGVYGLVRGFVKARELGHSSRHRAQITTEDGSPIVLLACDRAATRTSPT